MTCQCCRGRARTPRRPRVRGDAGYIRSIAASCTRKPFGGCNLDQIATTAMVSTHVPSAAAFQTQACCCLRDACIPDAWHKERAACRLASRREQAGRGRPVLRATCEHPDARLPSATCQMWRERPAHTAGPYEYATNASFKLDGRDLLAPCASLRPHRWTPRGRMRGVGATCTAPTTHGRPRRMVTPDCCKTGAG